MKNLILKGSSAILIVMLALAMLPVTPAYAAICTSRNSGNWGTSGTWTCGHVPLATDDVRILGQQTITVNIANAVANSVTINSDNNGGTCGISIGAN